MRIGEEGARMNHALLGIYFPSENMFDVVSTYSIDIDTLLDFQIAEYLMRKRHLTNKNQ
jgi:hypothetical protein